MFMVAPSGTTKLAISFLTCRCCSVQRSVMGRVAALEAGHEGGEQRPRAPLEEAQRRNPGDQPENGRQHDGAVEQRRADDDGDEVAEAAEQGAVLRGDQLQQQGGEAERRQAHDPADDHQAQLLQFADQVADVAVAFAADDQRNAEKEGDRRRQDLAIGQRLNGFWNRPRMNWAM